MVNFQRMRDELDDIGTQVTNKLPPISRRAFVAVGGSVVALFVLLGLAVCFAAKGGSGSESSQAASAQAYSRSLASPNFVFVSNGSQSCPPLK